MKLFLGAFFKFLCGLLLVGLLIFLPAGTFFYFGGWLFCADDTFRCGAPLACAGIVGEAFGRKRN